VKNRVVLIVDDDPSIHRWLTRLLELLGYVVMTAKDRRAAEVVLTAARIDAVILDLRLGDDSGLDVLDFVRSRAETKPMPVLMLTGSTGMTEDERESIRRQGARLFFKPAAASEIHAALSTALEAVH
jgi:DNA-binding response OmpR family regulator